MKKFLKVMLVVAGTVTVLSVLFFCLLYFGVISDMSGLKVNESNLKLINKTAAVFDNDGNEIAQNNYNPYITLDQLPRHVLDAFISIEDKQFYAHHGVNFKRLIKAGADNLFSLSYKEGASTITQQLIKNSQLSNDKTLTRKFDEILLAQKLEKLYSKDQILEYYLNAIYFGSGTFGIEQASRKYFNKGAGELTLEEAAALAGIIKSPKQYSPLNEPENCTARRNTVLQAMKADKKITQEQFDRAKNVPLNLNINENFNNANTYINYAIDEACELLNITEKDLILNDYKIYTFLDETAGKGVETALNSSNSTNGKLYCDKLALVLDNSGGQIIAYAGSSKYNLKNIKRQPGSLIKPVLVYAPAIEQGKIYPCSPVLDAKLTLDGYTPQNYNNKYNGYVTAKTALANSLNIPAIKILDYVGIEKAKDFAKRSGIKFNEKDTGYSVALGGLTDGLTLTQIANSYVPFANGGEFCKASTIKKIENKNGVLLYKQSSFDKKRVMGEDTAYLITDMLKATVKNGTAKKLNDLPYEVASKTGTVGGADKTNTDAMNISYTSKNTVFVWLGNTGSQNKNLPQSITGSGAPTAMAKQILLSLEDSPPPFEVPNSIIQADINNLDLSENNQVALADENTPEIYKKAEYFSKRHMPKEVSKMFSYAAHTEIFVSIKDGSAQITLPAKSFINYKIYRKNEDEETLITAITNKSGLQTIKDGGIKPNNFYEYYATAEVNGNITHSNSVKVYKN